MPDLSAFPITKRWPARHPERLQLYSLPTPNGVKVSIMLEEIGLPYEPHTINIGANELDLNVGNNSVVQSVTVALPSADIGLSATASANPLTMGNNLVYNITATNRGPNAALNTTNAHPAGHDARLIGDRPSNTERFGPARFQPMSVALLHRCPSTEQANARAGTGSAWRVLRAEQHTRDRLLRATLSLLELRELRCVLAS